MEDTEHLRQGRIPLLALALAGFVLACDSGISNPAVETVCQADAPIPAGSIRFDQAAVTLRWIDARVTLVPVEVQGSNFLHGATLTWTTSDPDVVDVSSDGEVIARNPGSAKVQLAASSCLGTATAVAQVEVTQEPDRLTVSPQFLELQTRDSITVSAQVLDAGGYPIPDAAVTFRSENPEVATVTGDGVVRGVAEGTAVIEASFSAATGRASVQVTNTPSVGQVTFTEDFEDGTFGSLYLETCCTHSTAVATNLARAGSRSAQIELRNTDPIVNNGQRAEITVAHQTGLAGGAGEERWFGFSLRPDAGWQVDPTFQVVTWQLHNFPDANEAWRPPALQIEIQGAQWQFWVRSDANRITQGTYTNDMIWTGRVDFGQWTDWVVHVKFAYDNTGVLEVWKNGEKVIDYRGPNAYNDEGQRYFEKAGLYIPNRSWSSSGASNSYRINVDSWKIADENGNYDAVAPGR